MKIRCQPDDFQVEEVNSIKPLTSGKYSLYILQKVNRDTLSVMREIAKMVGVKESYVECAGIKDKYARTSQFISVKGNHPSKISGKGWTAEKIGFLDSPIKSNTIIENKFEVVIRDLLYRDIEQMKKHLEEVNRYGVINYFDEQRFGSARHGKGFIFKEYVKGNCQRAVYLYIAEPSDEDRSIIKNFKNLVKANWGKWDKLLIASPKSVYRRIIQHLQSKKDMCSALKLIPRREFSLIVSAYQSFLWNTAMTKLLNILEVKDVYYFPIVAGTLVFHRKIPDDVLNYLNSLVVPLPSSKSVYADPNVRSAFTEVFSEEKINPDNLKLPRNFKIRVKPFKRKVLLKPKVEMEGPFKDELYRDRLAVKLKFSLPKGSYATLIVKRLTPLNPATKVKKKPYLKM